MKVFSAHSMVFCSASALALSGGCMNPKFTTTSKTDPSATGSSYHAIGSANGLSGNGMSGNGLSGNGLSGNGLSGNGMSGNGLSGNGMSGNGLSGNGMSGNGLSGNGLSGNGLSGNGLSGNGLSAQFGGLAGRGDQWNHNSVFTRWLLDKGPTGTEDHISLMKYVVRCALPAGKALNHPMYYSDGTQVKDTQDQQIVLHWDGLLGLAPEWERYPITGDDSFTTPDRKLEMQEWVSACLIAHTNSQVHPVNISVRANVAPLDQLDPGDPNATPPVAPEVTSFGLEEGGYYGNLFLPTPKAFACKGHDPTPVGEAMGRDCYLGHCPNISPSDSCVKTNADITCDRVPMPDPNSPSWYAYQNCHNDVPKSVSVQPSGTSYSNGTFYATFVGTPGNTYEVQSTDSLSSIKWVLRGLELAGADGKFHFADPTAGQSSSRFYQAVAQSSVKLLPPLVLPQGLVALNDHTFFVSDTANHVILQIVSGVVSVFAGSFGTAGSSDATGTDASFNQPSGLALDHHGNLIVADSGNQIIRRVSLADKSVSTISGQLNQPYPYPSYFNWPTGVTVDAQGGIFVADSLNHSIEYLDDYNGDGSGYGYTVYSGVQGIWGWDDTDPQNLIQPLFNRPTGVSIDQSGNLLVADADNDLIRKVAADGTVTTLAGSAGVFGTVDASGTAARFNRPTNVAVLGTDTYVADSWNGLLRKISANNVTTIIPVLNISGVSTYGGSVYVVDAASTNVSRVDFANKNLITVASTLDVSQLRFSGNPGATYQVLSAPTSAFSQPGTISWTLATDSTGKPTTVTADPATGQVLLQNQAPNSVYRLREPYSNSAPMPRVVTVYENPTPDVYVALVMTPSGDSQYVYANTAGELESMEASGYKVRVVTQPTDNSLAAVPPSFSTTAVPVANKTGLLLLCVTPSTTAPLGGNPTLRVDACNAGETISKTLGAVYKTMDPSVPKLKVANAWTDSINGQIVFAPTAPADFPEQFESAYGSGNGGASGNQGSGSGGGASGGPVVIHHFDAATSHGPLAYVF